MAGNLIQKFFDAIQLQTNTKPPMAADVAWTFGTDRFEDLNPIQAAINRYPKNTVRVDAVAASRAYAMAPHFYAGVRLKANLISSLPLRVVTIDSQGLRKPRVTGPLYNLLAYPNPKLTQKEMIWKLVAWAEITGDAWMVLDEYEGEPALFVLDSRWCTPVPDPDTNTDGVVYGQGKERLYYSDSQVFRYSLFNPLDSWYGMSPLMPLADAVSLDIASKKTMVNHMQRGGLSGGIFKQGAGNYSEDEIRKIKREMAARKENTSRLLMIKQEEDFKNLDFDHGMGTADDFIKISRQDTANAQLIPFSFFDPQRSSKWDDALAYFWTVSAIPESLILGEKFTHAFGRLASRGATLGTRDASRKYGMPGYHIEFDYSPIKVLQKYEIERAKVDVAYVMSGQETINERRLAGGKSPYEGEWAKFANTPMPIIVHQWTMELGAQGLVSGGGGKPGSPSTSPSLPMPGNQGSRDQGVHGEAQFIDQTGKRNVYFVLLDVVQKMLEQDNSERD